MLHTIISLYFFLFLMFLVTVSFKSREVTVKGPKGTLQRSFKHMSLDIQSANGGKEIKVDLWFGNRETIAAIRLVIIILLME